MLYKIIHIFYEMDLPYCLQKIFSDLGKGKLFSFAFSLTFLLNYKEIISHYYMKLLIKEQKYQLRINYKIFKIYECEY